MTHSSEEATFRISEMTSGEIEEVLEVERQCHSHPWSADLFQRELDNPLSRIDLLRLGGWLAGYLCSWRIEDELHIHNVATAPGFRRRGCARELLRHVLARAAAGGAGRAFLEVRAGNEGAIGLYRSFGFVTVSRRSLYYADGEDALTMEYAFTPCKKEAPFSGREKEE